MSTTEKLKQAISEAVKESYKRQYKAYLKGYVEDSFGKRSPIAWRPDTEVVLEDVFDDYNVYTAIEKLAKEQAFEQGDSVREAVDDEVASERDLEATNQALTSHSI